jgi:tRNA threonylcarbamoyladenosine biosynthesis protein TsaE
MNEYTRPVIYTTPALAEDALIELAGAWGEVLVAPLMVFLKGDLGAGKTTFTRAVLRSLGYPGRVKSPTYGILENYHTDNIDLVHLDLYRIVETGELEFLGLNDLYSERSVFMIEWPERGESVLPSPDLVVNFSHQGDKRVLSFACHSDSAINICNNLTKYFQ